jgi:hypothetical protein
MRWEGQLCRLTLFGSGLGFRSLFEFTADVAPAVANELGPVLFILQLVESLIWNGIELVSICGGIPRSAERREIKRRRCNSWID